MSKTELGEYGGYWRSGQESSPIANAALIAEIDEARSYEVDQTAIYADADGTFILSTASGCSCWDGKYYAVRYDTLEELFGDIGPAGKSEYSYNPSFRGVEELKRQIKEGFPNNISGG
jgi:hypothetical protein